MPSQVHILRRGIPVASGVGLLQHCTNVAIRPPNDAMDFAAKNKNLDVNKQDEMVLKTCKRRAGQSLPVVFEELIFEILIRLPVQTLMRFKSVCKAWHAIISDPFFIRKHLQQSTHKQEKGPSFLITPHTLDRVIDGEAWPTTFSNSISFYLWQEGQKDASLMNSMDFNGEFGTVYPMLHCDGLVMIPTDTKVYVLNPAIGDVLKLPDGHKDEGLFVHSVGLGLDLCTNKYKVVRPFYRSVDFSERTYDVGMEVFTLGGDNIDSCWRSTVTDPPYPVWSQPMYFEGSIYWAICEDLMESPPQGFLKFSLEDETFSFICYPCVPLNWDEFMLLELGGQFCLAQSLPTQIVIWVLLSGGSNRWVRHYVINLSEAWTFKPVLGKPKDGILVRRGNYLYRYDEVLGQAREVVCAHQVTYTNPKAGSFVYEEKDVFYFNIIIPYVESLVRVTRARSPSSGSSAARA